MAEYVLKMPKFGLTMETGTIEKWYRGEGERVQKGEIIVTVSSEKITNDVESPVSGTIKKILVREGEEAPVGAPIAIIEAEEKGAEETEEKQPQKQEEERKEERKERIKASPLARRLARELGIDLRKVRGTGPGGRIVKRDVEAAAKALAKEKVAPAGYEEREIYGMRKVIFERLQRYAAEAVLVTQAIEVDFTELLSLYRTLKAIPGLDISVTALVGKASAIALKEFPALNAHLVGGKLRIFEKVNLGVAVDTDDGLVVVVVKDADRKSVFEIAKEIREKATRARERKLLEEDMKGSTFTITNLGMLATEVFTPIPNPPEVAILGVGRAVKKPAVVGERIAIRDKAWVSITYDHRVVDGAPAARFLGFLEELLLSPERILKEG